MGMAGQWAICIPVVLVFAGTFARIMSLPVYRDEHMYVTAGVLDQTYSLYRDFPFLQTPFLPMVYGWLFAWTGPGHYLLLGRLLSYAFAIANAVLVYAFARRVTGEKRFAILLMLLFLTNYSILKATPYAWNAAPALTLSLTSVFCLIIGLTPARGRWFLLLAGGTLGLAISTKLYYLPAVAPSLLACMFYPATESFRVRLLRRGVPFVLGLIAGLAPIVWFALWDWPTFFFNNWIYHQLNTQYRAIHNPYEAITLHDKLKLVLQTVWSISFLILAVLLIILLTKIVGARSFSVRSCLRWPRLEDTLCILLLPTATAASLVPSPIQNHYLAMPVAYLFLLTACIYRAARPLRNSAYALAIVGLTALSCVYGVGKMSKESTQFFDISRWTAMTVRSTAQAIRHELLAAGTWGEVATLLPLWVVEAGIPLQRQFATGPFAYRVSDALNDVQRERWVTTSPHTVYDLLEKAPPAAVLVGRRPFEHNLDAPLIRFAEGNGYRQVVIDPFRLYVRLHQ
jgi:4-amino-4-deoxy-L-arabinose transferase-like glycosyltransferase